MVTSVSESAKNRRSPRNGPDLCVPCRALPYLTLDEQLHCLHAAHTVLPCICAAHTYHAASMQLSQHHTASPQLTHTTLPPHSSHSTIPHRMARTVPCCNHASHTAPYCIHTVHAASWSLHTDTTAPCYTSHTPMLHSHNSHGTMLQHPHPLSPFTTTRAHRQPHPSSQSHSLQPLLNPHRGALSAQP